MLSRHLRQHGATIGIGSFFVRTFMFALSMLMLGGCGGGGAGGDVNLPNSPIVSPAPPSGSGSLTSTDPSAPLGNIAPIALVKAPRTTPPVGTAVQLDGSDSVDPEGTALTYQWSLSAPNDSSARLTSSTSATATFVPDIAGTYVASLVVSDGAKASAMSSATIVIGANIPPAIQMDKAEPLSEATKLFLTGTVNGAVTWYLDLKLLGTGNASDSHSISWATSGVGNGSHQILARIQTGHNTYQELQRTVTVSNSAISISANALGTTGIIIIDTRASSAFGIKNVSARLDGKDLQSLTQPNACSRYCFGTNDIYRYTLNSATIGSALGSHRRFLSVDSPEHGTDTTSSLPKFPANHRCLSSEA